MVIITIDGKIIPKVATIAPKTPFFLYPIKVAVFTEIIPGVLCPIA